MRVVPRLMRLSLVIPAAFGEAQALAQVSETIGSSPEQTRQLQAVTVQGNVLGVSKAEDTRYYPGSRQVIGQKALTTNAYRSLDDALQHVPGIKIFDETGTGVLPQIMLRGLYESRSGRVQVLEDGIPLSLAPYGQTSLSLFPVTFNQIDRIDVVRGGAAVQYGPNNVGGVINLVSKPIPQTWTTTLGERLTAGGAGHFLKDTYVSTGGYLTSNFGMQLDADWLKGRYWRDHSDTDVKNMRLRTEWWLDDTKLIKAGIGRYVANMDLAGALSVADYEQKPRQATRPLDTFYGRTTRSDVTYQQDLGAWGPFDRSQLNWTSFGADSMRNFVVGMRRAATQTWSPDLPPQLLQSAPRNFRIYATALHLALHMQNGGVSQQWVGGIRAERENIDFIVGNTALVSGAYTLVRDWKFEDRAFAAYVSDAIGFFDDRLTVTPGIRYERLDSTYRNVSSAQSTQNNIRSGLPGLTIGYKLTPKWYVYADAQRSLRPPQVTQIIYGNNLDAELAWNYEAGARYVPGAGTSLSVDLYRIDFNNQIMLDNTTRTYANLGKTRHQGLEAQFEWSPAGWRQLKFDVGYAYLDASQRSGPYAGLRVPYTSRHQLNVGVSYDLNDTTFALNGYYFSRAFTDAANTSQENAIASVGVLPSYTVWNAQVTHIFMRTGRSTLKASLALNNLANRRYYFRGIDTSPWGREPAPGRTLTLGAELTF